MKTPAQEAPPATNYPAGRLIIQYLQQNKSGASVAEILNYLKYNHGKDPQEIGGMVQSLLENGTALGFLERKGSHFIKWEPREVRCGCKRRRRRRSRCRRRRRRRRSRRRCRRRRRRC